jgi:predicted ABC-type ATPase
VTEEEKQIEEFAYQFARKNKKTIAKRLTDTTQFPAEEEPVSVFMAGSPGAGKTEAAIELIEAFDAPVIRIDIDELRPHCPGYAGSNAWLFQRAAVVLAEKMHDLALEQRQSFVFDGTFSNYEKAVSNVERSLGRNRAVQILYVYQEPSLAWQFVQAREALEGRRVQPEQFVDQYFSARDAVNRVKGIFGKRVAVDLLIKNVDNSNKTYRAGIDRIDFHVPERFSRAQVEQLVKSG